MHTRFATRAFGATLLMALTCQCAVAQGSRPVSERPVDMAGVSVGFAPYAGAEELVLRTIASAKKRLRVCARLLSSERIARALVTAKVKNRVDVAVVVDGRAFMQEDPTGKARTAMELLTGEGVPLRLVRSFERMADNFIIADDSNVQIGSMDYSEAGAHRFSGSVVVLRQRADVAQEYTKHWESIWRQGLAFQQRR